MNPAELKAALERGTPGPWWVHRYPNKLCDLIAGSDEALCMPAQVLDDADAHLITLAVNLAPLFLELWEAAEAWRQAENEWGSVDSVSNRLDGIVAALDRLAAEGGGEQ